MPLIEVYERVTTRSVQVEVDDDPFKIEQGCDSPFGHYPIASCGDVVCVHCSKVFWQ